MDSNQTLRILFVEDVPADVELAERALRKEGLTFRSTRVDTQAAFLKALAEFKPDVILSDYSMPEFDGMQALKLALAQDRTVPFILLTGSLNEATAVACMKAGATDYVLKDRLKQLPFAVKEALEQRKTRLAKEEAERALRESEEQFRTLFEHAPVGIGIADLQGNVLASNKAMLEMGGYTEADHALVSNVVQLYADVAEREKSLARLEQQGFLRAHETRFKRKDGNLYDVALSLTAFALAGKPARLAIVQDITERKHAEEEIRRRADEFAALYETTHDLTERQDLSTLLGTIVDRAMALLRTAGGGMYLYDETRGDLFVTVSKNALFPVGARVPLGQGMAGRVAQTRQPLIVNNYQTWEYRLPQYAGVTIAATLEVPMIVDGELIGVLVAFEIDDLPRQFSQDDARLLSLFAGLAAGAVRNARLLVETQQRAQRQAALYHISTTLAQLHNPRELCQAVVDTARETLLYHFLGIFLVDPESGDRVLQAHAGWDSVPAGWRIRPGMGVSEKALLTGELQYWRDATLEPTYVTGRSDTRSEVDVPIKNGDTVIGLLVAEDPRVDAFDQNDFGVLQALANQLAVALENARLFAETKARAEQFKLLYDAGLTLNRTMDSHTQLDYLCQIATRTIHADNVNFFRYYEASRDLVWEFGAGLDQELGKLHQVRFPLGAERGLIGWVAQSGAPLNLLDVTTDPRWIVTDPAIRSAMWVPVMHDHQLLGVLSASSVRLHAFTSENEQMFVHFANQFAVASENARLYGAEQERSEELKTLYDLSREFAENDDFNHILDATVREMVHSCKFTFVSALLQVGDELVAQATCPIRVLPREHQIGQRAPMTALSLSQRALHQAEPTIVRTTDLDFTDGEREFLFLGLAQWGCLVPFTIGDHQQGFWILGEARNEERKPFTEEKLRLVVAISKLAVGALERSQLRAQTQRQLSQLQALHTIDTAIAGNFDLRSTCAVILDQARAQLQVDAACILWLNPSSGMLEYIAGNGFRTSGVEQARLRLGDEIAGRAALERRTIHIADLRVHDSEFARSLLVAGEDLIRYYGVPLIAKGELRGVLEIFLRSPISPNPEWREFMETLAGQAAIAVDNSELFNHLQQSNLELTQAYDKTIEGWSRALDLRDKETEGHAERVTEMTVRLARQQGIAEQDLMHIRRGAFLHDIGKMGIPDAILLKPGSLTPAEWKIMRLHPTYANEMLAPITFLQFALDIPYCHHEKWNGTGYPRGLAGEQIPLAARIFAIADVWDAVRSDRPYRPAWTDEKALEHIRALAGTHFDPAIVQIFLEEVIAPASSAERKKTARPALSISRFPQEIKNDSDNSCTGGE